MPSNRALLTALTTSVVLGFLPLNATAQTLELSQSQLRQLVSDQQVIGAEQLMGNVAKSLKGEVMDIRGFAVNGQMTYRLVMQRNDGALVEVLVDGQDGQLVSHQSTMGQAVAKAARSSRMINQHN